MPENTADWTPEDLGNGVKEARFYVNDYGAKLVGHVDYGDGNDTESRVDGWVGIVDNYIGGMVLYVEPSLADDYCLLLNKAHEAFTTEAPS